MVDTRDPDRIGELGDCRSTARRRGDRLRPPPRQEGDIDGADDRSVAVGATTSILATSCARAGIAITPLEASVMLLGIHEDTGSLTYPGATAYDAEAAALLMASGADMEVVNQFLARTLEPEQRALLSQLTASLEMWDVNGQQIAVGRRHVGRVRRLGRRALALRRRGHGVSGRDRGRAHARPNAGGRAQPALRGRRRRSDGPAWWGRPPPGGFGGVQGRVRFRTSLRACDRRSRRRFRRRSGPWTS